MFKDKKVLILGLSKSGTAAAKILNKYGANVTVNEIKEKKQCSREVEDLENTGVKVVNGYCDQGLVHPDLDFIVKNPGIPYHQSQVMKAREMNIPVVTEVEIGFQLGKQNLIGITGTNGKTTTTMLVHDIFTKAKMDCALAGNIGHPLVEQVETHSPQTHMITELSSFQLQGIQYFRPHIGCLLNITPAHLDYHGSMDDYSNAKLNLFKNQTKEDFAILPIAYQNLKCEASTYYFSADQEVPCGVMVKNNAFIFKSVNGEEKEICSLNELRLPGKHNAENAAAAICISVLSKVPNEAIISALNHFEGAEHRLEWVTNSNGVRYYNDSKATNPLATKTALDAFKDSIIHIAGGKERGEDFDILTDHYTRKVKAGIYIGETASRMADFAYTHGVNQVRIVETMKEAVTFATWIAKPGDTILLSPGCASWDMYDSFEKRGEEYKKEVKNQSK